VDDVSKCELCFREWLIADIFRCVGCQAIVCRQCCDANRVCLTCENVWLAHGEAELDASWT
jgi:hypothetical protein